MKNKLVLCASSLALVAGLALAAAPGAVVRGDEPPPEPLDCPLCGGNPTVHARSMIEIESLGALVLTYALRW